MKKWVNLICTFSVRKMRRLLPPEQAKNLCVGEDCCAGKE